MKRMLINATQKEELRVALVDGQKLYDLDIEAGTREQKKSNIYKGKITRLEPSLEAAFVDFGAERHGFLPLKEISREYFRDTRKLQKPNIKDMLSEGQEVIVQVDKEERGNKGAALTTFISLAGRYLVLMPNNGKSGGISRRIEGEERDQLKEAMAALNMPKAMGVIIRTAGVGRTPEELQLDLDYLVQFWDSIKNAADNRPAPFLIYQESNVVIRAVRDYLREDIGEVLIDDKEVHQEALNFIRSVMPNFESKIKFYQDDIPLFNRYQIESQIETAFQREVKLPSGGSIVIDPTEALVSIDINSSKATRGVDIEETALQTNLEAADEISRQLRLRDIGGLIVIDFIDMTPVKNQRDVENRMKDALEVDRARVQIGKISRFGLLEMSRQRLRPSLGETRNETCPRCKGQGSIRGVESLSLSIMRLLEEEGYKDRTAEVRAICPNSVATYLLNEKRSQLAEIEKRNDFKIVIIPSPTMETPHFDVQRIRDDNPNLNDISYEIRSDADDIDQHELLIPAREAVREQAVVKAPMMTAPVPAVSKTVPDTYEKPSFRSRLKKGFSKLFGGGNESPAANDSSMTGRITTAEVPQIRESRPERAQPVTRGNDENRPRQDVRRNRNDSRSGTGAGREENPDRINRQGRDNRGSTPERSNPLRENRESRDGRGNRQKDGNRDPASNINRESGRDTINRDGRSREVAAQKDSRDTKDPSISTPVASAREKDSQGSKENRPGGSSRSEFSRPRRDRSQPRQERRDNPAALSVVPVTQRTGNQQSALSSGKDAAVTDTGLLVNTSLVYATQEMSNIIAAETAQNLQQAAISLEHSNVSTSVEDSLPANTEQPAPFYSPENEPGIEPSTTNPLTGADSVWKPIMKSFDDSNAEQLAAADIEGNDNRVSTNLVADGAPAGEPIIRAIQPAFTFSEGDTQRSEAATISNLAVTDISSKPAEALSGGPEAMGGTPEEKKQYAEESAKRASNDPREIRRRQMLEAERNDPAVPAYSRAAEKAEATGAANNSDD
jgi:ribonuclease E